MKKKTYVITYGCDPLKMAYVQAGLKVAFYSNATKMYSIQNIEYSLKTYCGWNGKKEIDVFLLGIPMAVYEKVGNLSYARLISPGIDISSGIETGYYMTDKSVAEEADVFDYINAANQLRKKHINLYVGTSIERSMKIEYTYIENVVQVNVHNPKTIEIGLKVMKHVSADNMRKEEIESEYNGSSRTYIEYYGEPTLVTIDARYIPFLPHYLFGKQALDINSTLLKYDYSDISIRQIKYKDQARLSYQLNCSSIVDINGPAQISWADSKGYYYFDSREHVTNKLPVTINTTSGKVIKDKLFPTEFIKAIELLSTYSQCYTNSGDDIILLAKNIEYVMNFNNEDHAYKWYEVGDLLDACRELKRYGYDVADTLVLTHTPGEYNYYEDTDCGRIVSDNGEVERYKHDEYSSFEVIHVNYDITVYEYLSEYIDIPEGASATIKITGLKNWRIK